MADFLKIWLDLRVMAKYLPVPLLKHHVSIYNPTESAAFQECIKSFNMPELESSEYRSAYHQFSDWLYGWSVSDVPENGTNLEKRIPREINLYNDKDRQESNRLMKTFETLVSVCLRQIKVCFIEIELQVPRIGQGLETITNSVDGEDNLMGQDVNAMDKLWGQGPIPEATNELNAEIEIDGGYKLESNSPSKESSIFESDMSLNASQRGFSLMKETQSIPEVNVQESKHVKLIEKEFKVENPYIAVQRDINHVYREVDKCAEYFMVALSGISAILAFSQMLADYDVYAKAALIAHQMSQDFVSNSVKTVWDLLNRELVNRVDLEQLREPQVLQGLFNELAEKRAKDPNSPRLFMNKIAQKFQCIHDFFTLIDIYIFPNFAKAHVEGLKCAKFSDFDSHLWLTGGNDCIIRITDIRKSNNHICLAQYVGHKSVISDIHFTKNDSHIVSSSYDRTIKIWNAQTAFPERTLVGHTDAVSSCDLSPDGRYIGSGSLDGTVRLWDFATGDLIITIKKHVKWVNLVRFSHDGRYLASSGLDRRFYLWDVKLIANSKAPSHTRCIDSFNDYLLAFVLIKPNHMICTSRDSMIRMFDYMSGHELRSFNLGDSWACTLSVSSNLEYFATGSFDNNINIFRIKDFVRVREIRVFNLGILCVRFPDDLSYLVVGTVEGMLQQIML